MKLRDVNFFKKAMNKQEEKFKMDEKRNDTGPEEIPSPVVETELNEHKTKQEDQVDPSWLGVVTPQEVAETSDPVFKANQLNLLFSIYNELRELNKEIKDLK